MKQRPKPSQDEIVRAWDAWLDGDSAGRIHRYDLPDHSIATVREVLAGDPPESLRDDLRYVHGARFLWISARGIANPDTGKQDAFVVVQTPRSYTADAFRKGIRGVRRAVRDLVPGGDLELAVLEGFESHDTGLKFVHEHGYLGFAIDGEGNVSRIGREPVADAAPGPGM